MELTSRKTQTPSRFDQDYIRVGLLLLIAFLSYGFFFFSEFVTSDQVRYAIGFSELSRNGAEPFNYEMSFGYYLALQPFMARLPTAFWPLFLNGLGSLTGTLLLISLYFLIKSLFHPRAAFLTGLFLIFSPPFWLLTRYGHPAIPALTGPLLMKAYPFKIIYQGRPITTVPIEPLFSDYFLRKQYLEEQKQIVNQVIKRTDRNVVIISDTPHVPWYEYGLLIDRRAFFFPRSPANKPGEFSLYQTGQNRFYLWVIDWQSDPERLHSFLENESFNDHLFHISPFIEAFRPGTLFIEQKEMASLIKKNPSFFEGYRQIIKPPIGVKGMPFGEERPRSFSSLSSLLQTQSFPHPGQCRGPDSRTATSVHCGSGER